MVRLAELLAAVSLATNLADDAPFESALGDALTSLELARLAGLSGDDLTDVYYLAFLYHLGCTEAADSQAKVGGGDDVSSRRWFGEADFVDRRQLSRLAATRVARDWGPVARAKAVAGLMTAPKNHIIDTYAANCEVGARLGERLGAGPRVTEALQHAYAGWDGRVFFLLPSRDGISLLARLVHLVHAAQVFHRLGARASRRCGSRAPLEEARALEGIGHSHRHDGNPRQAAAHLRHALAIYERIGAPDTRRVQQTIQNEGVHDRVGRR